MKKKILFDQFENYIQTDWYLNVARRLGFSSVLMKNDISEHDLNHSDYQIIVNPDNIDQTIKSVIEFNDKYKIDAIVSKDDARQLLKAHIAEALKLSFISVDTAKILSDKYLQKKYMTTHNIPCARFQIASSLEELKNACRTIGYPIVIKPVSSWGSMGVVKVDNSKKLASYYDEIKANILAFHGSYQNFIVEEYLPGDEVSVEGIIDQGKIYIIAITDKIVAEEPFFVEIGHTIPTKLPATVQQKLKDLTIAALEPLSIRSAGIHVEIKLTPAGLKVNEIHARFGGAGIPSIITMVYGIDLVAELIKSAAGERTSLNPKWNKAAAIRFIVPHSPGVLLDIKGEKEITKQKGVCYYQRLFNWCPGRVVDYPPKNSKSRIGMIHIVGNDLEDVCKKADDAIASVEIITNNLKTN